jgi:CRP-like cAMP-binding protein
MLAAMAKAPMALVWRIQLFSALTDRGLKTVADRFRDLRFEPGSVVVEEGTGGLGFFVIETGIAKVTIAGSEVRRLGPGDHFGELALIAGTARTATVTAETAMLCHGLDVSDFRTLVEKNPSISWKLLQELARRLLDAEQRRD